MLAQTSDAGVDGYVFENVEMSAATVAVIYRDADKAKIASAEGTVSGAQPGEECSVTIGEATPIVGFSLNVVFDPAKVPAEAKSCDIEVLDAEGTVLARVSGVGVDGYVFENMEMSAATVAVIYKDADGKEIASANGTVTGAQRGEECDVAIGEATPIKTLVTIDIANSYPMNVTKVTYEVEYNSTEGDSQTAKGTADYTVTDETGSCSISFEPQGEDVAITNVKLSNPQNEIPFEWLTYSEAQAVQEDGTLVLDVNDNEFAGGAGTESDPFLVGNPRQLRQIETYCVGTRSSDYYYYKQIKDIDFEGSCGITIDLDYNDDGELTITPNMVDKTARFNEDNSHGGSTYTCAGWCPLAGNNDRANDYYFRGTYDGDFHAIRDVVSYLDRNHDDSFRMHGDASLFGQLQTSRFVNMSLTDCVMCGDTSVGLLYSFSIDRDKSGITSVAVENCTFKGIVAGNDCIGGVCGLSAYLNASDCKTSVEIYGAHEVGGMCGKADFTLKVANCETVCDMHVCKSTDGWSVGRLGGVCGQVKEFGVESCKANTTMTQYCYSSAVELVFGGLFGECLGYWDYNTLSGKSKFTLDCREVYNKSFGGGVFGVARYTDDTSLKAFMRDCVAVTTVDLEGSTCGQYCGSPKIDSLD